MFTAEKAYIYHEHGLMMSNLVLQAIAWCAVPFPQYPLPDDGPSKPDQRKGGRGAPRVQVNFWFFLFVYYGFYNLTALVWITKVFNLYSLNWSVYNVAGMCLCEKLTEI